MRLTTKLNFIENQFYIYTYLIISGKVLHEAVIASSIQLKGKAKNAIIVFISMSIVVRNHKRMSVQHNN